MSLVASFLTMPATKLQDLLDAAIPGDARVQKPSLFSLKAPRGKPVDRFAGFLREHDTEQTAYPYSGTAFCDLDLVLETKGKMLFDMALSDPSDRISATRGTSMAIFDRAAAQRALASLKQSSVGEGDVARFFREDARPQDAEAGTPAVLAAYYQAQEWLASVGENDIGLLIVG